MKSLRKDSPSGKTLKKQSKPAKPRFIVGIGSSAGGLEALEAFFKNCPAETGMGFVIVSHLEPSKLTLLPELVQAHTPMKVELAKDNHPIEPDRIYVSPPGSTMDILKGRIHLLRMDGLSQPLMPIDHFFRSLSVDQGENAVGVVLSGMGSDGALGLRAIKDKFGLCIVQDPENARYSGMPQSAIENCFPDLVLPAYMIPGQLLSLIRHGQGESVEQQLADSSDLQKILILLRTQTGQDFSQYKPSTICRRVERRMMIHQIEKPADYVQYLQQKKAEVQLLFKELLIGVTSFFRDPLAFENLRQIIYQRISNGPTFDYTFRVWVPGCATGEEAYTIAMLLRECTEELRNHINIQVFSTDIDAEAVEKARIGLFPANISADVNPQRLKRFFSKEDDMYRIKKDVRDLIVFAVQNVIQDPPFTKLDLLSCRNLMIYMNADLQKRLLSIFHYSLKPDGLLFLGPSETIGFSDELFSIADKKWKIYRRKNVPVAIHANMDLTASLPHAETTLIESRPVLPRLYQLAGQLILTHYVPSAVIIDPNGDILFIHGRTGKYLEPAPGMPSANVFNMAREGLSLALSAAVRKALTGRREVIHKSLGVQTNGACQKINLIVKPIKDQQLGKDLLLILFEDVNEPPAEQTESTDAKNNTEELKDQDLKKELEYTKENLQATIEELQAANEELKSTNEELQSTNEELQSTNEELETSKEEQQSLNEELTTVNSELQNKLEALSHYNDDMRNLMDSIEIPTIFLDNNLCIKRFTKTGTEVVKLIPSDVGRPLSDIVTKLKYTGMVEDAKQVIKTLVFKEQRVESEKGRWYIMRILPYRTTTNVIDGVVMTFLDITNVVESEEKLKSLHNYADNILDAFSPPLFVLDEQLKIVSANHAFYAYFKETPQTLEGRNICRWKSGGWNPDDMEKSLNSVISENGDKHFFDIQATLPGEEAKVIRFSIQKIFSKGASEKYIVVGVEQPL